MTLYIVGATTLVYVLALLLVVIREKNLRRVAQARLELAKIVTEIEQLKLKKELEQTSI